MPNEVSQWPSSVLTTTLVFRRNVLVELGMTDLLASLNGHQARLIACIGAPFLQFYKWPVWSYVETEFDRDGLDAQQILATLPQVNDTRRVIQARA